MDVSLLLFIFLGKLYLYNSITVFCCAYPYLFNRYMQVGALLKYAKNKLMFSKLALMMMTQSQKAGLALGLIILMLISTQAKLEKD